MLDTAFYLVLNMSVASTVIGLLLVALRVVKRIPRLSIYALWGLIFLRLVVPFFFTSEVSILRFAGNFIKRIIVVPSGVNVNGNEKLTMSNVIGTANNYFPVTYKNDQLQRIFRTSAIVWIIGVTLSMLVVIFLYYASSRELHDVVLFKDNIYMSKRVKMPMVYGMLRQKIIIPFSLKENESELKYIFLHEQVHVNRHDNLYRFLGVLTACLHWFNPVIWVYLGLFFKDMEISCDMKAISLLSQSECKKYAQTLVNFSVGQRVFMSNSFSNKDIKGRVLNVMNYKKMTNIGVIFSVLFIFIMAMILLTNPMK